MDAAGRVVPLSDQAGRHFSGSPTSGRWARCLSAARGAPPPDPSPAYPRRRSDRPRGGAGRRPHRAPRGRSAVTPSWALTIGVPAASSCAVTHASSPTPRISSSAPSDEIAECGHGQRQVADGQRVVRLGSPVDDVEHRALDLATPDQGRVLDERGHEGLGDPATGGPADCSTKRCDSIPVETVDDGRLRPRGPRRPSPGCCSRPHRCPPRCER